ncbi:U6 snRNA phosphodiesterase [Taenia solium]|eukprot:TsM_000452800 transcript=TsM_000452800 gene=TsM_000452800
MALVGYSSSEDEDGCEDKEGSILPSFTCDVESDGVRFAESGRISCSDGRVRGFAHKHGNWATCVFFPASASLNLFFNTLLNNVNTILSQCEQQFYTCDDFHLSVTKTWPILHHWIVGFTEAVRGIAANHQRPCITLGEAGFLVNEERTRLSWCLGDVENIVSPNWKKTCLLGLSGGSSGFVLTTQFTASTRYNRRNGNEEEAMV